MKNGLLSRVEHLEDVVGVGARIEVVADVELLEVLVTVELLVIGVGNRIKARLILRGQHRFGVSPEVRAGHGHDMTLIAGNEATQVSSQLIVGVSRNVMKLIHGDQAVIKSCYTKLINRKTERGMGAHQHFVAAFKKST